MDYIRASFAISEKETEEKRIKRRKVEKPTFYHLYKTSSRSIIRGRMR